MSTKKYDNNGQQNYTNQTNKQTRMLVSCLTGMGKASCQSTHQQGNETAQSVLKMIPRTGAFSQVPPPDPPFFVCFLFLFVFVVVAAAAVVIGVVCIFISFRKI